MSILSALGKAVKAFADDMSTPESFKKGEDFENYVRENLFIGKYYDLLERTHDYQTNKDYVKSSLKPDFKFRDRLTKREFYVEVKYRNGILSADNKLIWCNDKQLARYLEYDKQTSVFILLGIGGTPKYPEYVSLIPLAQAKYTGLFPSVVERYGIDPEKPIPSKILWSK